MANPLINRIAMALGVKVTNERLDALNAMSVTQALPAALAASALPAQMRAAILAVPPLTIAQIPERIAHAQGIADICAAAAQSIKNPIFNMLAPGYAMAGAQLEQVRRDITEFLSDYSERVTVDNSQPATSQGSGVWDRTIARAQADPSFGRERAGVHGD